MQRIPGNRISWDAEFGGVADMSDVFPGPGRPPARFEVESHRTGKVRQFEHVRIRIEGDGDVVRWVYVSDGYGAAPDVTVTLFND